MRAALLSLLMGVTSAASAVEKPCAWIVEPTADRENILFPEVTTRYLAALIPAPPMGYVEVTGKFPHAPQNACKRVVQLLRRQNA